METAGPSEIPPRTRRGPSLGRKTSERLILEMNNEIELMNSFIDFEKETIKWEVIS